VRTKRQIPDPGVSTSHTVLSASLSWMTTPTADQSAYSDDRSKDALARAIGSFEHHRKR
jgi:hypothetical protein